MLGNFVEFDKMWLGIVVNLFFFWLFYLFNFLVWVLFFVGVNLFLVGVFFLFVYLVVGNLWFLMIVYFGWNFV